MVRIYTKLIAIAFAFFAFNKAVAQIPAYTQDFGGVGNTSFPGGWTFTSGDWLIDPNDMNGGGVPTCTVAGSSGNSEMAGGDGSASLEQSVSNPFSTVGFSNLTVKWNGFGLPGAPTLSLEVSSDNVSYTSLPFTNVTADGAWHTTSTISIPAGFEGLNNVYLRWSYTGTGLGNFFALDDISVVGVPSPIFYWDGSGPIDDVTSWWSTISGTGLHPANFTANNQIFNLVNNTSGTLSSSLTIGGSGSALVVGDGATGINFIVNADLAFNTGAQMLVLNTSTLTLQSANIPAVTDVVINTGSTIDFAQSTQVSIWAATYSNLTISGGADKDQAGSPVVNGILNLNGRSLVMRNSALFNLNLNGTITGSGSIKTGGSKLNIGGSGAFGTINFGTGFTTQVVNQFNVNRTGGGSLTLGTNLTTTSASNLQNGTIDLNGNALVLGGAITFPNTISNGCFIGSNTSSLTINGSGSITNSLFMNQGSASSKTIRDLTMNRNAVTLTIGNSLNIINSITPTLGTIASGGNVTLKADATRSAMVGVIGGSMTGNLTVETIAATSGTTGWTNLSPTVNGLTVSSWDGQFPMSCSGCINDENSAGGYFVSIQGWNEAASGGAEYVELTGSSALTLGKGFWVYLGTGSTSTSAITITNSGTIGQGNFTTPVTVSAQSGDNLVSNPYPAPINWSLVAGDASNSNLDGSAIVYSPAGGQITLNGSGASTPGGFISGGIIPRGQGFYVHATSGGNVTFKEAHKSTANTAANPILRSSTSVSASNEFRLSIAGPYAGYDEALFIFDNNATTSFDRMLDAYKMFSTPGYLGYPGVYSQYTSISSQMGNKNYAINALPINGNGDLVIPILAKAMVSGSYTIAPIDIQNIPAGSCVTLKDKLLGVDHNLRTGAYVCTLSDTAKTARFELTVCRTAVTTGFQNVSANSNLIFINQDQNGAYVKTSFEENTKATISAYNTMGQKLIADKEVEGKEGTTYLDLGNVHSQVVIIKVTTAKESSVKKLFVN
ncbi:MAG: hypothetical protein V4506_02345 [Bacteroidota bacterium]